MVHGYWTTDFVIPAGKICGQKNHMILQRSENRVATQQRVVMGWVGHRMTHMCGRGRTLPPLIADTPPLIDGQNTTHAFNMYLVLLRTAVEVESIAG